GRTILQIIVDRAVEIVRARLRDNVHDATQRPAIVGPEAVVYDAKFADRFLRGRRPLRSGRRVYVVSPIHGHAVVQVALAAEGNSRDRRVRKRGLKAGPAGRDAGAKKSEIGEKPAIDGQGHNLRGINHLTYVRARGW